MKQVLLFSALIIINLSCKESEIAPKLSMNEQVALHLQERGYSVKFTGDQKKEFLISGFNSLEDAVTVTNEIFESMGRPEAKFIVEKENSGARAQGVHCSHSGFYDSGGAQCTNYICVADESFSILSSYDCFGDVCIKMMTFCY